MIAIGRYLLLIISLAGMTLAVDRFSKEDIDKFLDYIFRLHNAVRRKHDVRLLKRTEHLDSIAHVKMNELPNNEDPYDNQNGTLYNWMYHDKNTKLDAAEAIKFFSLWYEKGNFYNYEIEPPNASQGEFTQIVWAKTKRIGLTFRCEENRYKVLAVYDPFGNTLENYTQNVKRPKSSGPATDRRTPELVYQTETEKFLDHIFELHNEARIKHGVPLLQRDYKLDWAVNYMIERNDYRLPQGRKISRFLCVYDENTKLDAEVAKEVFALSYMAATLYNYREEPTTSYTDDFTQIVWMKTQRIGLGILKRIGVLVVVALYEPGGNIQGEFISNVLKPISTDQAGPSGNN